MSRLASVILALAIVVLIPRVVMASSDAAQTPRVQYTVTLDQPQTQFVGISQVVHGVTGDHIDFRLPVWRPGRYVVMNQAQSIRDFRAVGDQNQPLKWVKTDKSTWQVALAGSKSVRIDYQVYCNSLSDRTRHADDTHAFLDGATVFMYTDDSRREACWVHINKPDDWRVACGLDALDDSNTLVAADYDTLVDSPLEIGVHETFDFDAAGKPHRIVIWGEAKAKPEELKRDFAKVVEEQTKIFGTSPYARYLFIIHAGMGGSGGTEHVNSTVMQTSRAALEEPAAFQRLLSLLSHEFFHTWNIKSFRPAGLNPYEYQRENYTDLLWVAEGTTSYYSPLILVRAGFTTPTRYIETLASSINSMRNRPGDSVQSVAEASFDSWIHYGVRTPDDVNATVDFYGKGALVSLLIDLEMRKRSGGKACLDDVMRLLYERFPLAEGKGYTTDDLQAITEELTLAEFDDVFDRNVRDAQPLEFEKAFETVGLELYFREGSDGVAGGVSDGGTRRGGRSARPRETSTEGDDTTPTEEDAATEPESQSAFQPTSRAAAPKLRAYLGLNLSDGGAAGLATVTSVLSDGPAFTAGILPGDEVIALDERRLTASNMDARLRALKPGQTITLISLRRDELRTTQITLAGKPDGRWSLRKMRNVSDEQKAAYESWLGQKW